MAKDNSSGPEYLDETLSLLHILEEDKQPSQRGLATRIGVALGLANALVKRCVAKGLIKIQEAPARRYVYYLTPEGFAEKARLVRDYLEISLSFFRRARSEYSALFENLQSDQAPIAVIGDSELAEIAFLSASATGKTIHCFIFPGSNLKQFHGIPVQPSLDSPLAKTCKSFAIADSKAPQALYDSLLESYQDDAILAPTFLRIHRADTVTGPANKSAA